MKGVVLDSQALALLDGKKSEKKRRLIALLSEAARAGLPMWVPSSVFAQSYFDGAKQAELMRFIARPWVTRQVLDFDIARKIGSERHRTRHLDVVDQHVAALSREADLTIVTSDSDYTEKLGLELVIRL